MDKIIEKIIKRETLKDISKLKRLLKDPLRTAPYYLLASLARIKPFIVRFKTLWGDTMTGDLPNANTFIYYGYAEANLTNFIIKNLKENNTFIDGGANIGFYTLLAAKLVGNKGQVHSFEPTPKTFQILKHNTTFKKNVEINKLALLDREGEVEFIDYGIGYNAFNSINKRLNIKEILGRECRIKIKTTTIDSYCGRKNISPDFIKLDLEGSEYSALLGSENTIRDRRPIISIEVAGGKEWIDNIRKVNTLLKRYNYSAFSIKIDGSLNTHGNLESSYTYDNLIYIPEEKIDRYYDNN